MHYSHGATNFPEEWRKSSGRKRTRGSQPDSPWGRDLSANDEFTQWKTKLLVREPRTSGSAETKFMRLVSEWKAESGAHSSIMKIAMHPSYQKMIGMGREALPLLFERLRIEGEEPDHWFWALASITGENPVPKESRGRIAEMSKAWLNWGHAQGYVNLD